MVEINIDTIEIHSYTYKCSLNNTSFYYIRTGMMRSFLLNVYNLGNEVGFGGSKHVHVDKVVEDIPVR